MRIFADKQTDNQLNKQSLIQKLRPPFPLWSVDTRVAGQYSAANGSENSDFVQNSDQMLEMVRKWSEN